MIAGVALRLLRDVHTMARSATAPKAPTKPHALSERAPSGPSSSVAPKSVPPPLPKPKLVSATFASATSIEAMPIPPPPAAMVEVIAAYEAGHVGPVGQADTQPPSSGVRISEKMTPVEPIIDIPLAAAVPVIAPPAPPVSGEEEEGPKSYQVYSLADLDKRHGGPVSLVRTSLTQLQPGAKGPTKWARSKQALWAVVYALRSWVSLGKGRPPLRDAIRAPGQVLVIEVKAALKATDWKRVGTVGGVAAAIAVALLTVVLVVADLTDDMKPTHTGAAAAAMMPTPEPEPAMMTAPAAPTAPIVFEDVYESTPPPVVKPKPAPRAKARIVIPPTPGQKIPKGKKPGDLLIPY